MPCEFSDRLLDAITAPRMHSSATGRLSLEASRVRTDIQRALRRHGFTLDRRGPFSFYMGCVQMVVRQGRVLVGAADPRRDGAASGPSRPETSDDKETGGNGDGPPDMQAD
jgi:gamma-glutamyltranspeptidase/glutathione hydrolase